MLGQYAVAVGRGAHRHALKARAALSPGWQTCVETRELLLVATTGTACLHDAGAILVGQMFDEDGERLTELPALLGQMQGAGGLRRALGSHWGNYALFAASKRGALAYRDPSASIPVHRCGGPAQTVFVSDAEAARRLGLLESPGIDREFLIHWLQFPFLRTRRTGLVGVTEILPGTLLTQIITTRLTIRTSCFI